MKKISMVSLGLMAAMVVGLVFSNPAVSVSAEVIKLKYSSPFQANELPTIYGMRICDLVEQKTNGQVKIDRFLGGTLAKLPEHLQLVSSGSVDLATILPALFLKQLPLTRIVQISQQTTGEVAMANTNALMFELPDAMAVLEKEHKKNNVKFLYCNTLGPIGILSRVPATCLNDLKGKKVNASQAAQNKRFEALGMIPVGVQIPEFYEALSRGVIDLLYTNTSAYITLKLYEVGKSFLDTGLRSTGVPVIFNLNSWNRLPDDVKQRFLEASRDTSLWSVTHDAQFVEKGYDIMRKAGVTVGELPKADKDRNFELKLQLEMEEDWVNFAKQAGVGDDTQVLLKYWRQMAWGKFHK
jgi:TRAP-type C4-dicarboxylate transport system substrate-binding protein